MSGALFTPMNNYKDIAHWNESRNTIYSTLKPWFGSPTHSGIACKLFSAVNINLQYKYGQRLMRVPDFLARNTYRFLTFHRLFSKLQQGYSNMLERLQKLSKWTEIDNPASIKHWSTTKFCWRNFANQWTYVQLQWSLLIVTKCQQQTLNFTDESGSNLERVQCNIATSIGHPVHTDCKSAPGSSYHDMKPTICRSTRC